MFVVKPNPYKDWAEITMTLCITVISKSTVTWTN